MKSVVPYLGMIFWVLLAVSALTGLFLQAQSRSGEIDILERRIRRLDRKIQKAEGEVDFLKKKKDALKSDSYRWEVELRKRGNVGEREEVIQK